MKNKNLQALLRVVESQQEGTGADLENLSQDLAAKLRGGNVAASETVFNASCPTINNTCGATKPPTT